MPPGRSRVTSRARSRPSSPGRRHRTAPRCRSLNRPEWSRSRCPMPRLRREGCWMGSRPGGWWRGPRLRRRGPMTFRPRRRIDRDRGSATVYALALVAGLVVFSVLALGFAGFAVTKHRAAAAADLAALAGAAGPAEGCALAESTASRNGARLTSCVVDGPYVTVSVEVSAPEVFGFSPRVPARARAGPVGPS
ncbi:MAG: hypothetical protein GEU93_08670 [Propionibacteriales bacterium]|nr:hypothetical protein [Propionibacteriales bacterium]